MGKQVLRLVRNKKVFYVPSLQDYELLKEIGVPLLKVSETEFPLLTSRCKSKKIVVKTKSFVEFEEYAHKKIKANWDHTFDVRGDSILIEVPRKKSLIRNATSLVRGLKGFYGRHLFDVDVKVRKFSQKVRFILERQFNEQKEPEWKEVGR